MALVLFFSFFSSPANAQDESYVADWLMPRSPGVGHSGIVFMEPTIYPGSSSYLNSLGIGQAGGNTIDYLCRTLKTETCESANSFSYQAYVPVCRDESATNCIENFWLVLNDKKYFSKLDRYMPESSPHHFTGDVIANLPEGKSTSIWKVSDPELSSSELYFSVSAIFKSSVLGKLPRFSKPDIEVVIDPIIKISGQYSFPKPKDEGIGWTVSGCLHSNCGGPEQIIGFCSALDNNLCAKRINNLAGVKYGIKLRITQPPITWIHGRLTNPEFKSESSALGTAWTVEAEPIALPVISSWVSINEAVEKKFFATPPPDLQAVSWSGPYSSGSFALSEFNKWIPFMGDKAEALQKRWSFRTIKTNQMFNGKSLEECMPPSEVAGVVISNATVYQGEPPIWNAEDATLDYKVAAPHYTPLGEEFKGLYQLKINGEFARCIYGFENAPIVATVSIVASDGAIKVATSTVSADSNWINFNAAGFTFSNPTIKVKLALADNVSKTTPQKSEIATTPKTAAGNGIPAKKIILCTKGKTTKTVKAVKPKCPKGYKKK